MTDTLDALVERLRYEFNSHPADTDRKEAAAAIEALRKLLQDAVTLLHSDTEAAPMPAGEWAKRRAAIDAAMKGGGK